MKFKEIENLNEIIKSKKGIFIFKQSLTCCGSTMAKEEIESFMKENKDYDFYIVKIQNQRELSNKVTEKLNVEHESPQLIFIRNGEAMASFDHGGVSKKNILDFLEKHVPTEI